MALNGAGTYARIHDWTQDEASGLFVEADRMDEEFDDIATALTTMICKDGQTTVTANIPFAGFKLTNVGDATSATDVVNRQFGDARYQLASGAALTLAGALTTVGAYATTLTMTAITALTLPTTGTLATLAGAETLTNKTVTSPDINGGTADALTSLGIRSTGTGAFDLTFANTENLTAGRALTLKVNNAARTVDLAANLTVNSDTTISAFGASLIDDAAATNARTTLGLVIGTDVQAYDATLLSIAALGTAADKLAYTTGIDTWAETAITSFGRSLIDDTLASDARTTLGLAIGTDVQAYDATLLSIAALGTAADKLAYTTGIDTWAETAITTFGRSLIDDAAATDARTTLGLGTAATAATGISGTVLGFLDGGNTWSEQQTISLPDAGGAPLILQSTDVGALAAPYLVLDRFSATPANNDLIPELVFRGRNDAAGETDYAAISSKIISTIAAAETGQMLIKTLAGGAVTTHMSFDTEANVTTALTFPNTGLHILDTNSTHDLIFKPGSNLTADRTLTITTGDADVTLDVTALQPLDTTLTALAAFNTNGLLTQTAADTFTGRTLTGTANQLTVTNGDGVSGNPTISLPADIIVPTVVTAPNTGLHVLDTDASHDLIFKPGSNLTADRTLAITTGDSDRTLDISAANVTVSSFAATILDDTTASDARTTLGLGTAANIQGTTTNDNATSGYIGEHIYSKTAGATSTVTISNASPGVISWTAHGLLAASAVTFTTTGALPTGLTVDVNYYVCAGATLLANSFTVATTAANAIAGTGINTSSAGSGVHTATAKLILATTVTNDVAAISLTAGDWDVEGSVQFNAAGGATVTAVTANTNNISATNTGTANSEIYRQTRMSGVSFGSSGVILILPIAAGRISIASTTTIFLVASATFSGAGTDAYGVIRARRMR